MLPVSTASELCSLSPEPFAYEYAASPRSGTSVAVSPVCSTALLPAAKVDAFSPVWKLMVTGPGDAPAYVHRVVAPVTCEEALCRFRPRASFTSEREAMLHDGGA
jgi:hypothetical protein